MTTSYNTSNAKHVMKFLIPAAIILLLLALYLIPWNHGTLETIYQNDLAKGYEYIALIERSPQEPHTKLIDDFTQTQDASALYEYILSLELQEKLFQSRYKSAELFVLYLSSPGDTFKIDILDKNTVMIHSHEPLRGSLLKGSQHIAYTVSDEIDIDFIRSQFSDKPAA